MQQFLNWAKNIGLIMLTIILLPGGCTVWNWVQVQQDAIEQNKRKFDTSLEFTKAIVGFIGTGATIAAGIVLFLNYKNAEDKLNHEKDKAKRDADLAESRLLTERFSKAVEQLSSEQIAIRIGGIYTLERIAKDSPSDHWIIMEILTAFIRERSPIEKGSDSSNQEDLPWHLQPVATDIQAALTIIGRREIKYDPEHEVINLSRTKLFRADLSDCRLVRANLSATMMRGSNLTGAMLTGANLLGSDLFQACLINADLSDAQLCYVTGLEEQSLQRSTLCGTKMPDGSICDRDCKNRTCNE